MLEGRRPVRRASGVFPVAHPSAVGPEPRALRYINFPVLSFRPMAGFVPVPLRPLWATLSEAFRDELLHQEVESCTVFSKLFAVSDDRMATVLELGGSESDFAVVTQLLHHL